MSGAPIGFESTDHPVLAIEDLTAARLVWETLREVSR